MAIPRTISVVVPAYNEMGNLEASVRDVVHALRTFDDYEVIIVNDGSQDGTGAVADQLADPRDHLTTRRSTTPFTQRLFDKRLVLALREQAPSGSPGLV